MGLHEKTISNGNFLNIKHGAICLESKEPIEGYEEVIVDDISKTIPDGKGGHTHPQVTKYIKKYAALDGKTTRIEWYDRTNNGVHYLGAKLHVRDGGQHFQLDLPFGKKHFDYFTKVMDNIDFSQKVEFNAWKDRKDPRQTAFVIKQNGDYVQWAYTKENMGDCPPAVQNRSGKWSFEAQREWLLARLQDVIIPAVDEINKFDEPEPEYEPEEPSPVTIQNVAKAATAANDAVKRTNKAKAASAEPPMPPFDPQDEDVPEDLPF